MSHAKLVLGVAAGLLMLALPGGSGARRADRTRPARFRPPNCEATSSDRASVLDARVAIYSVDFGEASRHLEDARGLLVRASGRIKSLGRDDELKEVQTALTAIDDAQRMAGKLDRDANSRAGEVAKMLADVLAPDAKR